MRDEAIALCKKLKVPLLSDADIASLRQLQKEWRHWEQREQQLAPLRIAEEQKAAYAAFLDNPTLENEQCLAKLADPVLVGTRYALLRRAFTDIRRRITKRAGEILQPVAERVTEALNKEHAHRLATAEMVMSSIWNNPVVKESGLAVEQADRLGSGVLHALWGKCDKSPLEIAYGLVQSQ